MKLIHVIEYNDREQSLPTWERGLKFHYHVVQFVKFFVAPYMGAWIEMKVVILPVCRKFVAPYMGAWIEI